MASPELQLRHIAARPGPGHDPCGLDPGLEPDPLEPEPGLSDPETPPREVLQHPERGPSPREAIDDGSPCSWSTCHMGAYSKWVNIPGLTHSCLRWCHLNSQCIHHPRKAFRPFPDFLGQTLPSLNCKTAIAFSGNKAVSLLKSSSALRNLPVAAGVSVCTVTCIPQRKKSVN